MFLQAALVHVFTNVQICFSHKSEKFFLYECQMTLVQNLKSCWKVAFVSFFQLRDNDLCNFCQIEEEPLIHLFWNCTVTSCFWHNFRQWLLKNETSVRSLELTPSLVIGLKTQPLFCKNFYFVFLVARLYLWTCRIQKTHPTINTFPVFLSHYNL